MPADTHAPQPPSTAEEFCSRGMEKLRTGNWKDAIDDFTQAIRLRPDVAAGYRFRAISDLDQAIRLKPDDVQALFDRGQFFLRQRQYDEALTDCNKAVGLDPGRADVIALRGRV